MALRSASETFELRLMQWGRMTICVALERNKQRKGSYRDDNG